MVMLGLCRPIIDNMHAKCSSSPSAVVKILCLNDPSSVWCYAPVIHQILDFKHHGSGLGEQALSDGHCAIVLIPFSAFSILGVGTLFLSCKCERDQGAIKAGVIDAKRVFGLVGVILGLENV
jgi:hypothetical protein